MDHECECPWSSRTPTVTPRSVGSVRRPSWTDRTGYEENWWRKRVRLGSGGDGVFGSPDSAPKDSTPVAVHASTEPVLTRRRPEEGCRGGDV